MDGIPTASVEGVSGLHPAPARFLGSRPVAGILSASPCGHLSAHPPSGMRDECSEAVPRIVRTSLVGSRIR